MSATTRKRLISSRNDSTMRYVAAIVVLIALAVLFILATTRSFTHADQNTNKEEAPNGNATSSNTVSSDFTDQSTVKPSSDTFQADPTTPSVNLTVNGQTVDVPDSGTHHTTVTSQDGNASTDVTVRNHSTTKTTVRGSSTSTVNLNVSTTTNNTSDGSAASNNDNGMPPMPAMPAMP